MPWAGASARLKLRKITKKSGEVQVLHHGPSDEYPPSPGTLRVRLIETNDRDRFMQLINLN